jgi:hypothetical protein
MFLVFPACRRDDEGRIFTGDIEIAEIFYCLWRNYQ